MVIIDRKLMMRLKRIKRREWWPVALLATEIGRPKQYIYRRIESGDFDVIIGGEFTRVISESVIVYFQNMCNN